MNGKTERDPDLEKKKRFGLGNQRNISEDAIVMGLLMCIKEKEDEKDGYRWRERERWREWKGRQHHLLLFFFTKNILIIKMDGWMSSGLASYF